MRQIKAVFFEALFVLAGIAVTLALAALFMHLCAPISTERYAYLCVLGAFIGFAGWLALMLLFFKNTYSERLIPAAIAVLSCSLAFQVIVPMTIERSITVFMLNEMAREPMRDYSAPELKSMFLQNYVEARHAIQKRLEENSMSGIVAQADGRYRLTGKGEGVVGTLAFFGRIFSVPQPEISQAPLSQSKNKR